MGPLDGIQVLDFTTTALGPYCTMLMAQSGASVIKVESRQGDILRGVGQSRHSGMSATYMTLNAGKRSVVIDAKCDTGREIIDRLIERSDVVIHNMRLRTACSLGLTYERLSGVNPKVILAEAIGFARGSPDEELPAYDDVIQAASGLADLERRRSGSPQYVPAIVCDKTCALFTLWAVTAALFERGRTGRGQRVTVPMYESMVSFLMPVQLAGESFVPPIGPVGYARTLAKHRRPYRTKDGYINAMPYTDRHWEAFFRAIGQPKMSGDPRFRTITARTEHIDELYAFVEQVLAPETTSHWLRLFRETGCPAIEVRDLQDLATDSYLRKAGIVVEQEHPTEGTVRTTGMPVRFSEHESDHATVRHAPRLGEHTIEVLTELGYTRRQIQTWAAAGVIPSGDQELTRK